MPFFLLKKTPLIMFLIFKYFGLELHQRDIDCRNMRQLLFSWCDYSHYNDMNPKRAIAA